MEYFSIERSKYTIFVFSSVFIYGMIEQSRSIIFPIVKERYGLSYTQFGTLITTIGLAYTLATFIGTFIVKKLKYQRIIGLGYFLSSAGLLLAAVSNNLIFYLIGMHTYCLGYGFEEIGINSFLSTYFKEKSGRMISLYHGLYGAGSIVSPYLVNVIIKNDKYSYYIFYYILCSCLLLLLIISLLLNFNKYYKIDEEISVNLLEASNETEKQSYTYKSAFKDPIIIILIIALGLQVNVESSANNWSALYLQDVWHLDKIKDGSLFLTIFYIFFTVSRMLFGYVFEKIGYLNVMLISSFGGMVVFIIGFSIGKIGRFVLMCTGFFVAMFWPCAMCLIIEIYGANAPFVTSLVIGWEALFYYILSFLQGVVNDHIGPAWGYRSAIFISLIVFFMLLAVKYLKKRKGCVVLENVDEVSSKIDFVEYHSIIL